MSSGLWLDKGLKFTGIGDCRIFAKSVLCSLFCISLCGHTVELLPSLSIHLGFGGFSIRLWFEGLVSSSSPPTSLVLSLSWNVTHNIHYLTTELK